MGGNTLPKKESFMRIMGIDYGDARTGVAISDLLCSIVGSTYVAVSYTHLTLPTTSRV